MKLLSLALPFLAVSSCQSLDIGGGRLGEKKRASFASSRRQGKDIWRPDHRRQLPPGFPAKHSNRRGHYSDVATRKLKEWRRRVSGEAQTLPPMDSPDEVDMEEEAGQLNDHYETMNNEDGKEEEEEDVEGPTTPTESKQLPWGFELSDITPDPAVKYGELENGIRYVVLPNSEPPGQMEINLHMKVGAFYETEEEFGMSHFMEHMLFRSTKNYPDGRLIETFQQLGLGYGADVNAYTAFDETVYMQSLPKTDNTTTAAVFKWLRDILDGALFLEEEMDIERGIVQSEEEAYDSGDQQVTVAALQWQLPDHIISKRYTIGGPEETINAMTRDMFVNYYTKWYNTRRATVVVVGDMSTEDMEQLIVDTFESVKDLGERAEDPELGPVPEGYGLKTQVFVNRELADTAIWVEIVKPSVFLPDTESKRARDLQFSVINDIIWNRINDRTFQQINTTALLSGYAYTTSDGYGFDMAGVSVRPKEGRWNEAVAEMEQVWRRVITYGFTQYEVDIAKGSYLNAFEQSVLSKDKTPSESLVGSLAFSVNARSVFSTPEEDLRIAAVALDGMTPETLHELYRSYWDTEDVFLYMYTPSVDGTAEDAAAQLEEAFLASQDVEVEPPVEKESVVFAYSDFGPPGSVVQDTFIDDLEVRQMVLSNNVRVNMKQTDFASDDISFECRFGLGRLSQPKKALLDEFAAFVVYYSGVGEHGWIDLESLIADRSVYIGLSVGDYDFSIGGGSTREDLELGLQILAARIVDPVFLDSAVEYYRDEIPSTINRIRTTLLDVFWYDLNGWLRGGDERFVAPTAEGLLALEASDVSDWILPSLNSSYMECSFVGDFDEDATVDLILATLGAIPERENSPPEISEELRAIDIPSAPMTKSFPYETELPQAGAFVTWEIPSDLSDVSTDEDTSRHFTLLGDVVANRVTDQIEKLLGGAYSPRAYTDQNEAFDCGFLIAYAEGLPEEIKVFTDIMLEIAADMSTGGISQDEFDRARLPRQSTVEDALRDNLYWLYTVIGESQAKPFKLDWSRSLVGFYENAIVDDINNLAMEYLSPDNAYLLSIVPGNSTDSDSEAGVR